MRKFNAEMLTLARESRGLSQQILSNRMQINQSYLSKIEGGLIEPNDEFLQKLSEGLNYPLDFFYQLGHKYPSRSFHRKKNKLSQTDLSAISATANIMILHIRELLNDISLSSVGIKEVDIDSQTPEEIAQSIRLLWDIPEGPINNMIACVEVNGGVVMGIDVMSDAFDGVTITVPELPHAIFFNKNMPGDRIRFTIAHELGHAVMHRYPTEGMEEEANRFAAEFLMPEAEIKSSLYNLTLSKLMQLKCYWKVSMGALLRRAKDLGTITSAEYTKMYREMGMLGIVKVEPYPIAPEKPKLFVSILNFLKKEMDYNDIQIMQRFQIHEDDYYKYYFDNIKHSKPRLVKKPLELLEYGNLID
ncbi:MAG: XRE family transcriptional regulator [Candidatus Kapabacteria bacterium]|nr:XRE family transcriptional regulator [Candidatus Kapabacteria bacterium]